MENLIHMACTIKTVKLHSFPPCQQRIICFTEMLKRLLFKGDTAGPAELSSSRLH